MSIKKFIIWQDVHGEDDDNKKIIDVALDFGKDFKPDIFISGGDFADCDTVSHWDNEKRFKELGVVGVAKSLMKEMFGVKKLLSRIKKVMKPKRFIYHIGNHEAWVKQYHEKYGNVSDRVLAVINKIHTEADLNKYLITVDTPVTIDNYLGLTKQGIEVVPQYGITKLGKLHVTHGDNLPGTIGNVKAVALMYQANMLFGHFHTSRSFANKTPLQEDSPQIAECMPCMTKKNPTYNKNKANACVQGFVYGYVDTKSGLFNYYVVKIIKGKCIIHGKLYK